MTDNINERFCQTLDEMIGKRLEAVAYDQTILCTITDDSKSEQGIYMVINSGTIEFEAISNGSVKYRKNDNVYVQIPCGDWDQQKTIIAKKTNDKETPYLYHRPFSSFIDITNNLISSAIDGAETGLVANGVIDENGKVTKGNSSITLWTYNIDPDPSAFASRADYGPYLTSYTRLGLQGSFKSILNPFYENGVAHNVNYGDYGLRLIVTTVQDTILTPPKEEATPIEDTLETKEEEFVYIFELSCADMVGDPYNFQSYFVQEKLFDISGIGKIATMKLEFYQQANFTYRNGEEDCLLPYEDFGNLIGKNLFVNDPYVALGYDTNEDISSETVNVYTLDPLTFSQSLNKEAEEKNYKNVQLRWIHKGEDGVFTSITENDNLQYEIYWYRYELGAEPADSLSGVYWKLLSKQTVQSSIVTYSVYDKTLTEKKLQPGFFNTWLVPDTTLAEERIKAIILYNNKPYRSNILTFTNEQEAINKTTLDAAQALSIVCVDKIITYEADEDKPDEIQSNDGNYLIYGLNNQLLDAAQSSPIRYFIPYFSSSKDKNNTIPRELVEAESVEWIIPSTGTMIQLINPPDVSEDNKYHIIIENVGGENEENQIINGRLAYRIKNYYAQSDSNNFVQCKVIKDQIPYYTTKQLNFGVAGTTGSDCTLLLNFSDPNIKAIRPVDTEESEGIKIVARLFDYENIEVPANSYTVKWSWKEKDNPSLIIKDTESNNSCLLFWNSEIKNNDQWANNRHILQATIENWGGRDLTAYLPIPYLLDDSQQYYISGPTQVIYDSSGGGDVNYYKNPYVLYGANGDPISDCTWSIFPKETEEEKRPYQPKIVNNRLIPLSFYVKGADTGITVLCTVNNKLVWSQPLLILQNKYPSAMINEWDGNLKIGDENDNTYKGTILAPRLVAGSKDKDGKFSGVMMGDWESTNTEESIATGIYGFSHGEQSYAFKEDGTAFIGKSGAGRIEFDGTKGTIKASNGNMSIDLDDGTIIAQKFSLNAGDGEKYIKIDTTKADSPPLKIGKQFSVNWDGTVMAEAGTFSGTIDASEIRGGTITGRLIIGDTVIGDDDNTPGIYSYSSSGGSTSTSITSGGTFNSSNATITGGELKIGTQIDGIADFNVDKYGNVTIRRGSIKLGKVSDGYNFEVDNDGLIIRSGDITINKGSISLGYVKGETDENGNKVTSDGYKFQVTRNGSVTITNGALNIGSNDSGGYNFQVANTGAVTATNLHLNGGSITLQSKTEDASEAPTTSFNVTNEGVVTANSIKITGGELNIKENFIVSPEGNVTIRQGDVNITSGSINLGAIKDKDGNVIDYNFKVTSEGNVTASNLTLTGGKVGEWNVSGGAISNGATTLGSGGAFTSSNATITGGELKIGPITNTEGQTTGYNFIVDKYGDVTINKGSIYLGATDENGVTYKFEVDTNGKITAQNAVIQGEITADTGKIGSWTINKDGVLSADVGSDTSYFFKIGKGNNWESWIRGDGAAKFGVGTLSDYGLFIDSETGKNDIFLYANDGIKIGTTTTSVFYADQSGNLTIAGNLKVDTIEPYTSGGTVDVGTTLKVDTIKPHTTNGTVDVSTTLKVDKIEPYTTNGTITISSVKFDSLNVSELTVGDWGISTSGNISSYNADIENYLDCTDIGTETIVVTDTITAAHYEVYDESFNVCPGYTGTYGILHFVNGLLVNIE